MRIIILLALTCWSSQAFARMTQLRMPASLNESANHCNPALSVQVNNAWNSYNTINGAVVGRMQGQQATALTAVENNGAAPGAGLGAAAGWENTATLQTAQAQFNSQYSTEQYCTCQPSNPQSPPPPDKVQKWKRDCQGVIAAMSRELEASKMSSVAFGSSSSRTSNLLKYGALAAAGVGAYMLLKGKKDKDDDEDEDKDADAELAEKERAAGIITTADGKKIECFSQAHFQKIECEPTMLRLCQTDEKKNTGGCNSFNNFRCSGMGEGANTMYCLHAASETYCKQPGDLIKNSPACQWSASRPAECMEDPEAIECRLPVSAAALDAKCVNYPNDPVCKAKDVVAVVQPGSGSDGNNGDTGEAVSSIASNGNSDNSGNPAADNNSGGSDNNVPGSQAGNGNGNNLDLGDGAGELSLDSITSNGSSARGPSSAVQSSSSLVSTQSDLLKSLCSSGQLVGCPN